jgi:hypothetical protein
MEIMDTTALATVTGGASNPAGLPLQGGCVALNAANESAAAAFLKSKKLSKDATGNFTKRGDGPYPAIYGYEYWRGSRCAPGADD